MIALDRPATADELYLARGGEVEPYRPVLTGDVIGEITIPGVGVPHDSGMVISHPCNMRLGDRLRDRIQMLPIVQYQDVALDEWVRGSHARVFLLPESQLLDSPCAARFDETGMVSSGELTPARRRLCLSERGILLLLQRLVFSLCRADIPIEQFERAIAHVLAEAELLEEWNERLVPARGGDLAAGLAAEATAFEEFMKTANGDTDLRGQLRESHRVSNVRRLVRQEIARRAAGT